MSRFFLDEKGYLMKRPFDDQAPAAPARQETSTRAVPSQPPLLLVAWILLLLLHLPAFFSKSA
ncbi:MAG TPA: hypothetical protein VFA15_01020 [Nitrososphaera sp.]|nr:hypothetical protein [Nitrososphaera sp.]